MVMPRYGAKRDANEQAIFSTLRKLGFQVHPTDKPTDAVACFQGRVLLIEVKQRKGRLTEAQKAFIAGGWPVHIIRNHDDAVQLRNLLLERPTP